MRKERPILFSTPMVEALIAGRKTQTRRMIKPQPDEGGLHDHDKFPMSLSSTLSGWHGMTDEGESRQFKCPYGKPGDILWVRETWRSYHPVDEYRYTDFSKIIVEFAAENPEMIPEVDGDGWQVFNKDGTEKFIPWKPSIHMKKEHARIWLEVVDVRLERLQDISEEDARAEGVKPAHCESNKDCPSSLCKEACQAIGDWWDYEEESCEGFPCDSPAASFESLWDKINGRESWDANPWVWVISFKVLSTTGKPENF